ncbi:MULTISPECIES: anthranilate phosphoribosyltransferase [Leptospira]|uniref:Anthranilate phosphoribosyltransferase n=5 Tax=Leptospira TaxID=171 RepID=M3HT81_LEPBO|nr:MULTISPECIES: anthranilate phosphoribosyltransferase [Leptospira]EMG01266.1 anthranilate phosphoribosyltransferase [Leptospira borgpetersenii str. 200701203]EMO11821.1 anthranilate phosphoribosyltransferase [Leptospira borgpetersenii str. Noumea 25]ALO26789.1 anthranilate phosphoribosyltransferase [Leptospira borgpetersenii serovar Ballum]ANH01322.1 Anthranilate phosphoribosyltransferase [Leptospira borgpetersenii str. 4E]EKP13686.1 anthranilate phosphoribosyltransferase [Leptospira borgpet
MEPRAIVLKLIEHKHISVEEAEFFMNRVMKGEVSEILLSSFVTAMRAKGESVDEILGCTLALRKNALKPKTVFPFDLLDTCGTGGDGQGTINISTLSAITLASLGVKVAKHGNRSVSSHTGSSDILARLGYQTEATQEEVEAHLISRGFTFLFAPMWHPSMKYAGSVRKELGFRTVFNMIGPLSNPFSPQFQIIGVYQPELTELFIKVLQYLGLKRALVCHSRDGLDEFSIFQTTDYTLLENEVISRHSFDPRTLGFSSLKREEVYADSSEHAEVLARRVLNSEPIAGTHAVALNAGAGLFVMGKVKTIEQGYKTAWEALLSGKTRKYFEDLISKE